MLLASTLVVFASVSPGFAGEYKWMKDPHYNHDPAADATAHGELFSADFDDEKAIVEFTKALKINPKFAPALIDRAHANEASEHFEQANADYNALINSDDKIYAFIAMRARVSMELRLKQYQKAADDLDAMKKRGVHFSDGLLEERGSVLMQLHRYDEAIKDFDEAVKMRPRAVHVYKARAHALFENKKYKLALADCDSILAMDAAGEQSVNNNADILKMRADIYRILGMNKQSQTQSKLQLEHERENLNTAPFRSSHFPK